MAGYCDIADVQALNPTRRYGPQTTPSTEQVLTIIDLAAGELDGILMDRGITVPVPSTSTAAYAWLRRANAYGAAMDAEAAMFPASADRDETPHVAYLRRRWEAMLDALSSGDANLSDAPREPETSTSRGPRGLGRDRSIVDAGPWFSRSDADGSGQVS